MGKLLWKRLIGLLVIVIFSFTIFTGCVPETGEKTKEGAAIGAVAGAALGALMDKNNRWRGAVIGAAVGTLIGGTAGYIMDKAAKEAATTKKPVTYESEDGIQKVYAKPVKSQGNCEWVTVQYYEYGKLVKEEKRLVCPN